MGITIHYKGKISNINLIDEFCDELIDIAETMNWKASERIYDEEDKIKGVSVTPHEKSESLSFFFNIEDGALRNIMNVITKEPYNPKEPEWDFIKTQFAPPEVHVTVVKLLQYIKKKYMPDLEVHDEGDYWETGDENILREKLKFLGDKIDAFGEALNSISKEDLKEISECDDESMPEKFEKIIRKIFLDGEIKEITIHKNPDSDIPPEIEDAFLKQVEAFENAPDTTHFAELLKRGVFMPEPDELDDKQLHEKLWEVINKLAEMRVYLDNTNHLSDRELYTHLLHDFLQEFTQTFPPEMEFNCHIDICGSGSDEDIDIHYKYYADEKDKKDWMKDFPDYKMPEHEDPAFDRDKNLPRSEL